MGWADRYKKEQMTMEMEQGVRDLFGRPVTEGDNVMLNVQSPIFFRIGEIVPVLDPGSPPGMMMVHFVTFFSLVVKRGTPIKEIIRVQTAQEAGPMPFKMLDAVPMPAEEKPS